MIKALFGPWPSMREILTPPEPVEGARRSGMEEPTDWTLWAERVILFRSSP